MEHLKLNQIVNTLSNIFIVSNLSSSPVSPAAAMAFLSTSTGADAKQWTALANETFVALCNMQQVAFIVDGQSNPGPNQHIVSLCCMILQNSRILSTTAGSDLLLRCMQILVPMNDVSDLVKQVQLLIASPHTLVELRSMWYVMLVKLAVLGGMSESAINIETIYYWIEKHISSTPLDWHQIDFSEYYSFALDRELTCARSGSSESIANARRIAAAAVSRCPQIGELWDNSEEIERLAGNHAAANHLKWKKNNR